MRHKTKNNPVSIYIFGKFFPRDVFINNIPFRFLQQYGRTLKYEPVNSRNPSRVIYLRAVTSLEGFLPFKISVNGRTFSRRLNGFYTPEDFTLQEIVFFFDSIATQYEKIVNISLNKKVIFHLLKDVIKPQSARVLQILDYGIGSGISFEVASKLQKSYNKKMILHGVDLSQQMVKICREKGIKNVRQNDYSNILYPPAYFDCIIASFVVHYFINPLPFCSLWRALKPKGILAFNLHRSENDYQQYYSKVLYDYGFSLLRSKIVTFKVKGTKYPIPMIVAKKTHLPHKYNNAKTLISNESQLHFFK